MSEVEQIVQAFICAGIRLWTEGGNLHYRGDAAQLTPERIHQLRTHKAALVRHLEDVNLAPLSEGQRGLWYIQQCAPESSAYHVSLTLRIMSPLDVPRFQACLQLLVNRHAALRTTFVEYEGTLVQRITNYTDVAFQHVVADSGSESELNAQVRIAHAQPFDLATGPLLRCTLFTCGPQNRILLLSAHHIIVDGWSLTVLMDELFRFYDALTRGVSATVPLIEHTFVDYVRWQQTWIDREGDRLFAYWQEYVQAPLPVLQMHTDYPRPSNQGYRGVSHAFALAPDLVADLTRLARQHHCTFYMVLLAAYQILLRRLSGQDEVLVGLPMAGRSRPEFTNVVGYLTNPVVLRVDLRDPLTVSELLTQVRRHVLGAMDHQDYPFPLLVERLNPVRDPSRAPIFQADFVLQHAHLGSESARVEANAERAGLTVAPYPFALFAGQIDLALELRETSTEVHGWLKADADLFAEATIARMAGHFQTLLAGMVADPTASVFALPMLTEAERHQILVEWNDTAVDYPQDRCIHDLFAEQVVRTPDAVAVIFEEQQLTYVELNIRANQLAHHLIGLGVGPDVLVGLCVERSREMIIGLLGILYGRGGICPSGSELSR